MTIYRPLSPRLVSIFESSFNSTSTPLTLTRVSQLSHYRCAPIFRGYLKPAAADIKNHYTLRSKTLTASTSKILITFGGLSLGAALFFGLQEQSRGLSMSSKLVPSNPSDVAVIRTITPNVVTVSVPFARFGIIRVGGRGTIIRLTSGALAVYSPVALTPETQAKVAELGGDVRYIIAGDIEHHIFLSEWARAFPNAKIVGPKGLAAKRAAVKDDERIGKEPFAFEWDASNAHDNNVDAAFAADFDVEFVGSHPNKEVVLLYKPDRVLIQADLMFNLPAIEQYSRVPAAEKTSHALLNRIFEGANNTSGDAKGLKRFLWYVISRGDRAGFNESVRRINDWDFDTIVPCHGETIMGGGKELFRKAFEWHLQGRK